MYQINIMFEEIQDWMLDKGYETLNDFKGDMSHKNSRQPEYFERQQYIKALEGVD